MGDEELIIFLYIYNYLIYTWMYIIDRKIIKTLVRGHQRIKEANDHNSNLEASTSLSQDLSPLCKYFHKGLAKCDMEVLPLSS